MQVVGVLGDPALAGLGETEVALDDQEGMLDLRSYAGLSGFTDPVRCGHRLESALAGRDPELDAREMLVADDLGPFVHPLIAGIGVDHLVIGADQIRDLVQVVHVRGGRSHRVDAPGAGIDTDVGHHRGSTTDCPS